MIVEYAGSSVARAKRVAAIMPIALCSQLGHINNTSKGIFAKNIGLAKLKTWFVYCESDNCGSGPILNVSNKWVDSIMKVPGAARPRYTRLRNINPPTLYNCSDSLFHDAWSRAFDPNFKASYYYTPTGSVGANDGINLNMYQWFIRQLSTATASTVASSSELDDDVPSAITPALAVTINPNPFTSQILAHISVDRQQRLYVNLTDMTGRLVQSVNGVYGQGVSEVRMNTAELPSGIYFLKVSGENFSNIQKLIKK
jgi:hypothetical protein